MCLVYKIEAPYCPTNHGDRPRERHSVGSGSGRIPRRSSVEGLASTEFRIMSFGKLFALFRAIDRRLTDGIDTHAQLVMHGENGRSAPRRRA